MLGLQGTKHIGECTAAHGKALAVLDALLKHYAFLYPEPMGGAHELSLPVRRRFDQGDRAIVWAWKGYLRWEESDPLGLGTDDRPTFLTRVSNAYAKAVVRLRFFPEIWYLAFLWVDGTSTRDKSVNVLREGLRANPTSFVLTFAYAEALEQQGSRNYPLVHEAYRGLTASLRTALGCLESTLTVASTTHSTGNEAGPSSSPHSTASRGINVRTAGEMSLLRTDFAERRREYGVVWIMYMRFARRAEGMHACHGIFSSARLDRFTPWQVYDAAARGEYYLTSDVGAATRIYRQGMNCFGSEGGYIACYLDFLLSTNDHKGTYACMV